MKQQFELNEKVYIFRATKPGERPIAAFGRISVAEINSSGYIQYSVQVLRADGKYETWQGTHASITKTEDELKAKIDAFMELAEENKRRYEETFGKPDFSEKELADD